MKEENKKRKQDKNEVIWNDDKIWKDDINNKVEKDHLDNRDVKYTIYIIISIVLVILGCRALNTIIMGVDVTFESELDLLFGIVEAIMAPVIFIGCFVLTLLGFGGGTLFWILAITKLIDKYCESGKSVIIGWLIGITSYIMIIILGLCLTK